MRGYLWSPLIVALIWLPLDTREVLLSNLSDVWPLVTCHCCHDLMTSGHQTSPSEIQSDAWLPLLTCHYCHGLVTCGHLTSHSIIQSDVWLPLVTCHFCHGLMASWQQIKSCDPSIRCAVTPGHLSLLPWFGYLWATDKVTPSIYQMRGYNWSPVIVYMIWLPLGNR